jgi:hypothetical protein
VIRTLEVEAALKDALPWLWSRSFRIGPNQGFDGRIFGCLSGPEDRPNAYSSVNVLHEVSHAIELTTMPQRVWRRRVKKPDFELGYKTYCFINDQFIYEAQTPQASQRECRVAGIQLHLMQAGGLDTNGFVEDFIFSLKNMKDAIFFGMPPDNCSSKTQFNAKHHRWFDTREEWISHAYRSTSIGEIRARWADVAAWMDASFRD